MVRDHRLKKQYDELTESECIREIQRHVGMLASGRRVARKYHQQRVDLLVERMDDIYLGITEDAAALRRELSRFFPHGRD